MAATSDLIFNRAVLRAFFDRRHRSAATFLGVNYYGRVRFHNGHSLVPARGYSRERLARLGVVCDDMFERHPEGMEIALRELQRAHGLPLYVTEHGSASDDEAFRADDLRRNLAAIHRAIGNGADVRGFFYWSLLDNFEWQFGCAKRFGLLEVDFTNEELPRRMKPLADVYRLACERNCVP
jgi:beta-glucosidase/6-phospho-beta-glucosidase/beta-galactosidase